MKKTLIILVLLLVATWFLAMPALVGLYLRTSTPDWLAELAPGANARYQPGWFGSRLIVDDPAFQADLRARHFPPGALAWLRLDGTVQAPLTDSDLYARGQLGLTGRTHLDLVADTLTLTTSPAIHGDDLLLTLRQAVDGSTLLDFELNRLQLFDRHGNRLAADRARAQLHWLPDSQASRIKLAVSLDQADQLLASLVLAAGPVDDKAFDELLQGLDMLRSSRPDSIERQFALLTIVGAWQQMAASGLTIELVDFRLARQTAFSGFWQTAGWPEIYGQGDIETLLDWLGPTIGLSRAVAPDMAEREARAWLLELADRQWLEPDGRRFRFRYDASHSADPASSR